MSNYLKHLSVLSSRGAYDVHFVNEPWSVVRNILASPNKISHLLIDSTVHDLYQDDIAKLDNIASKLLLPATEDSKSLTNIPKYIKFLMDNDIKKGHQLIAIGGGIIQDITCFIAAILFRGIDWLFVPTTLLAQADSCVGGKSSINCNGIKNAVGTFTPPQQVIISTKFLQTLPQSAINSGLGEILKILAVVASKKFFTAEVDIEFIHKALQIKKAIVEHDEFDSKGRRAILNYGHSFGHAFEAATDFTVPHGIAVSIGMDMANYLSYKFKLCSIEDFTVRNAVLSKNYKDVDLSRFDLDKFLRALQHDKKNLQPDKLNLILLVDYKGKVEPQLKPLKYNDNLVQTITKYLDKQLRINCETVQNY